MTMEEIDSTLNEHPRQAKIVLGKAIVSRYYNEEIALEVAEEFDRVHRDHEQPVDMLKIELSLKNPQILIEDNDSKPDTSTYKMWVVKLLVNYGFAATNGEARRLITQGGVSINNNKLTDPTQEISLENGMVLKVGKRRFAEIVITQ